MHNPIDERSDDGPYWYEQGKLELLSTIPSSELAAELGRRAKGKRKRMSPQAIEQRQNAARSRLARDKARKTLGA